MMFNHVFDCEFLFCCVSEGEFVFVIVIILFIKMLLYSDNSIVYYASAELSFGNILLFHEL